ncbi:MAG TPA: hypothetical protein VN914_11275 [Polyangia bacterium]|nr:hypothetical protein [Polyangia bacterium]
MQPTRRYLPSLLLGLGLLLSCGDDKPRECQKPADCVGMQAGNYCTKVEGKGRCVIQCAGDSTCPAGYTCTGKGDDGSLFCKP